MEQEIDELKATLQQTQQRRVQVLEDLDRVEAEIVDANKAVTEAEQAVARAESAVISTGNRLGLGARAVYLRPMEKLIPVLNAKSLNDIVVARYYLTTQLRTESDALDEHRDARAEETALREELLSRRRTLDESRERRENWRQIIEGSVQNEQKLLEELQEKLVAAQQAESMTTGGVIESCPGSGAGKIGGHEAANQEQAVIYSAWPFGPVSGMPPGLEAISPPKTEVSSFYGPCFHGHGTASGAMFDQNLFTTASRTYPLGTFLLVARGQRKILVLVNDRGPYIEGRTLDLSVAGARALGFERAGVAALTAQIVRPVASS